MNNLESSIKELTKFKSGENYVNEGIAYLEKLIGTFNGVQIIAVGKAAQGDLKKREIQRMDVPHP